MIQKLYETLCNINETANVLRDEPMSRHTTFRIGGPAAVFCMHRRYRSWQHTVKAAWKLASPIISWGMAAMCW